MSSNTDVSQVIVYLIEDDAAILKSCEQALMLEHFEVRTFADAGTFFAADTPRFPYVVITDVNLPDACGISIMKKVLGRDPDVPVIVITGHGDINMAVDSMKEGAFDFIEKPFSIDRLITTVRNAVDKASLTHRYNALASVAADQMPSLIGQSERLQKLKQHIATLAPTGVDILINGETGTGKEVVAQMLHQLSQCPGPFVAINCAALPENIFESELFGHEAGAFTGASKRRIGKFEYANQGTLFLDEIESMPLALQAKLLRTIQERVIQRLGANESIPVSCRIIAATKTNLKTLSDQGQFRSDLYFRLNVVNFYLPALREIKEDIPLIFNHYLFFYRNKYPGSEQRSAEQGASASVLRFLATHDWPGNIRELKNFAERVALGFPFQDLTGGEADPGALTLAGLLEKTEKTALVDALRLSHGHVAEAAEVLAIPVKTLYDKLARYGIQAGAFKT